MTQQEKFECMDCGCFFWVKNRNGFECPNCKEKRIQEAGKQVRELNSRCDAYIHNLETEDKIYWQEVRREVRRRLKNIKDTIRLEPKNISASRQEAGIK